MNARAKSDGLERWARLGPRSPAEPPNASRGAYRRSLEGSGSTTVGKGTGVGTAVRRVITSIDEFVDPTTTSRMAPMVLRPGAMRAELVSVNMHSVCVDIGDYSFPVASKGESLADRVALLAPFGRVPPSAHVNGEAAAPGVAFAFGENAEVASACAEPVRFASMSFSPEVLERTARELGVEIALPGRGEHSRVRAASSARLYRLLSALQQSVRDTGKAASSIQEAAAVADALVEIGVFCLAADSSRSSARPNTFPSNLHIVKTCEEYAAASHYQNVSLAELCTASDVSERRARNAFYECYGMSPTAYLRVAALYDVRHALLEAPPVRDAVSRAAGDSGFWHLGRFASQYRALFGEAPSDTLAHRRGIAAG